MKVMTARIELSAAELGALARFGNNAYTSASDIQLIAKDREVAKEVARRIALHVQLTPPQQDTPYATNP